MIITAERRNKYPVISGNKPNQAEAVFNLDVNNTVDGIVYLCLNLFCNEAYYIL